MRRSPPFTVSLVVHLVALLALGLWLVRTPREDRLALDISFRTSDGLDDAGGDVQASATVDLPPEQEPEAEPAEPDAPPPSPEPPIERPTADSPEETDAPETPAAAAAVAPAVGNLLDGRGEGRRQELVDAHGGSAATEAAVAKALDWLVRQQDARDGLWSLQGPYVDGGSQENRLAATAMALLAFQGAGTTPRQGRHRTAVERAWKALARVQLDDGRFAVEPPPPSHHAIYAHAQATIAACELHGMTRTGPNAAPARRALAWLVAAQGPDGGWRYEPRQAGDMSVTGWCMMALKSGQMAGLEVPEEALTGIASFLDRVAVDGGARYGYRLDRLDRPASPVTPAVAAEGLLCRQYLGWRRDDPRLVAGIDTLAGHRPLDWDGDKDVYAWYYVTQVVHHAGGDAWRRWNDRLRDVVPARQVQDGPEKGSWDPSLDRWGHIGGRLFTTCFCAWMLEVYYRHLPLYGDAALAVARNGPDAP